jgi:hypothetical protein
VPPVLKAISLHRKLPNGQHLAYYFLFTNPVYLRQRLNHMKKTIPKWLLIISNAVFAYVSASMIVRLLIFILKSFWGVSAKLLTGNGINPVKLILTFVFISLLVFNYWLFSKITPRVWLRFSRK